MGKWALASFAAGGSLAADQISKLAAFEWLAPVGQVKVIPGFFDLTYVLNTGVAFGMMSGDRSVLRIAGLTAIALAALVILIFFIARTNADEKIFLTGLSLVAGGAVGNIVDRVRMGAVIDFLDFYIGSHHWPAFNVADIVIVAGTGLILLHFWRHRHDE